MWSSGIKVSGGFDSKIRLSLAADQAIVTATWSKILWDVADYDALSEFDAANNQIKIVAAGYYNVGYYIPMQQLGVGKACEVRPAIAAAVALGGTNHAAQGTFGQDKFIGGWSGYYAADTTFYLDIYHDFGANRALYYTNNGGARFWLNRWA